MDETSLPALLVRVIVSLGVVLGVMAAAAAMLRRSGVAGVGPRRGAPARRIEVLARHGLGRNAAVTVIRLGSRGLILGVTESQVTLLAETDPAGFEAPTPENPEAPGTAPSSASAAWKAVLEALRERTVRRS